MNNIIEILIDINEGSVFPEGELYQAIDEYVSQINSGETKIGPIAQSELLLGIRLAKKQGKILGDAEMRIVNVITGDYEVVNKYGSIPQYHPWMPGEVWDRLIMQIV